MSNLYVYLFRSRNKDNKETKKMDNATMQACTIISVALLYVPITLKRDDMLFLDIITK